MQERASSRRIFFGVNSSGRNVNNPCFFVSENPLFLDEVVADEENCFSDWNSKPQIKMENPREQFQKTKCLDAENNGSKRVIFQKSLVIRAICTKDPFSVYSKIDKRGDDPCNYCSYLHGADRGDPFFKHKQKNIIDAECHHGRNKIFDRHKFLFSHCTGKRFPISHIACIRRRTASSFLQNSQFQKRAGVFIEDIIENLTREMHSF